MTTFSTYSQRFMDELLWRGQHFNLLADKELESALYACEPIPAEHDTDEFCLVPADKLYRLPQPVTLGGQATTVVSVMLGNVFLVFRGQLAHTFAKELSLSFDQQRQVPRPNDMAGLLNVYVETTDDHYEAVAEDDIAPMLAAGKLYDNIYYRSEEVTDGIVIKQRRLIAYESSRFPGFTLLGTEHAAWLNDASQEKLNQINAQHEAQRQAERAAVAAEVNTVADADKLALLQRSQAAMTPDDAFIAARRQKFISAQLYRAMLSHCNTVEDYWRDNLMQADPTAEDQARKARDIQSAHLDELLLRYTAGEAIASLPPYLERLIGSYEQHQLALAHYEQMANIPPLAIDDDLEHYEEAVQVISLCILLQRTDLLQRFVSLLDNAGYAAEDTLYEDLLKKLLPQRHDVDEWYHEVYTPLIQSIYAPDKQQASELLQQYCNQWYPAFEEAAWYDAHSWGDEGSYVGYWAFEAAAIAFLYGIDDSSIEHMVYPKELVAYARAGAPPFTRLGL
ncbi:PoNe immunity protein domain-containing protein [Rheinheimera sp. EpRS3]|uniref:PoNe immunity protein domain-containing protein n=1 Tax=Rheinheimera sp. EpRS3 TaxID=1712383 RepID=UPI000A898DDE|nr:PoNe immunity protein domain-containing protein [Rheinheimera sp. EpRS3]